MPSNIGSVQKSTISSGFLDSIGEGKDQFTVAKGFFADIGNEFLKNLANSANDKKVVASGDLLKNSTFAITGNVLQIIVPDYYDFPNEGVKGWGSSKNAPGSPYQYKRSSKKGKPNIPAILSSGFGKSISKYKQSGRAKVSTVVKTKDKALGIGLEKKRLSLLETNTLTLMALIKKYGIKETNYFTDAVNATFGKDLELRMTEAFGKDIVFTIDNLNKNK
jgi:hypothetical protein